MTSADADLDIAQMRSSYFNLEEQINDLRHMASIAWVLFGDTRGTADCGTGWRILRITGAEFERPEFALHKTLNIANDLHEKYQAAFTGNRDAA